MVISFDLEYLDKSCASTVHTMEGNFVNTLSAPTPYTEFSIRGVLVILYVAPSSPERICMRLVSFLSIIKRIYTAYTHIAYKPSTAIFKQTESRFLIEQHTHKSLSIVDLETSFRLPESRALI